MQIPKKLVNEPLKEAIFEIRFDSPMNSSVLYGMLYQALLGLQEYNFTLEDLPASQIPEQIIQSDPNLFYQLQHQMIHENFVIGVGRKNIVFSNRNKYVGWEEYSSFIKKCLNVIFSAKLLGTILRVSMRYINVITDSLFTATELELKINEHVNKDTVAVLRTEIPLADKIIVFQLNNNVKIEISDKLPILGSMIDIDVIKNSVISSDILRNDLDSILNDLHDTVINQFYSLIKTEYLNNVLIPLEN